MKIRHISILVILFISSCNRAFYGKYRSDSGEAGLRELELRRNNTFEAHFHLCNSSSGVITHISKKEIKLTSYFQKDSLPVQIVRNDKNNFQIILDSFPTCFFSKYQSDIRFLTNCVIDSIILVTSKERILLHNKIIEFSTGQLLNKSAVINIYVSNAFLCSYSSYEYKISCLKIGMDYHIVWHEYYLDSPSLDDVIILDKNKLVLKASKIRLAKTN